MHFRLCFARLLTICSLEIDQVFCLFLMNGFIPECLCIIRSPGSASGEKLKHNLNDKLFQCPYNYRNTDNFRVFLYDVNHWIQ